VASADNPWTTLSSRRLYDGRFIALDDNRVRDAVGEESPYAVVRFKKVGLRILPIDNGGFTYLIGQHRYGADAYSWELPAGGAEPGEDFIEAARRELAEEAGLAAEHWLKLVDMVPSGSITDERQIGFVAWGFEHTSRDPDRQEVLRLKRVPFAEALAGVLDGSLRDAGTIAMLSVADAAAARGALPPELVRRITPTHR
jgi:8-oxo-dGTP pyrophosphatase MutT (NUDIX family)